MNESINQSINHFLQWKRISSVISLAKQRCLVRNESTLSSISLPSFKLHFPDPSEALCTREICQTGYHPNEKRAPNQNPIAESMRTETANTQRMKAIGYINGTLTRPCDSSKTSRIAESNSTVILSSNRETERKRLRLAQMLIELSDEAKILMTLRHPNITRFWGVCIQDDRQWLVSQYVSGGSLFSLIHSHKGVLLDANRITRICLVSESIVVH